MHQKLPPIQIVTSLIFGPAGPGSRQLRAAATKPSSPGDTTTNHGDNRVQGRATYGALPSHQVQGVLEK